jgi:hypothetical protein
MKYILLGITILVFAFVAAGNNNKSGVSKEEVELVQKRTNHPKRKVFHGKVVKVVTRADYVKTSNPKRLHWNIIHERNNPVKYKSGVSKVEGELVQKRTNHPKRKVFYGKVVKVVTRADYVKTSNPKRLHWNRIQERNNLVK